MLVPIIIAVVIVLLIIVLATMYNALVSLNVRANETWSGITVQLKRRADLIPNLVNTVKGYAQHESGVFERITAARAATINAQSPAEAGKAENDFQETLKSLFAVAEAYPDLKANQNFSELQTQLADTEDKIQASRNIYNSVVTAFNTKRTTFPTNLFAGMFGFKQDKEFFEVSEAQASVIQEPVNVKI